MYASLFHECLKYPINVIWERCFDIIISLKEPQYNRISTSPCKCIMIWVNLESFCANNVLDELINLFLELLVNTDWTITIRYGHCC